MELQAQNARNRQGHNKNNSLSSNAIPAEPKKMAPMFAGGMFKGLGKPPSNLDFQMNSLESMDQ
jgi:hypothetical protein